MGTIPGLGSAGSNHHHCYASKKAISEGEPGTTLLKGDLLTMDHVIDHLLIGMILQVAQGKISGNMVENSQERSHIPPIIYLQKILYRG